MPSHQKGLALIQLMPIEAAFEFQLDGHEDGVHLMDGIEGILTGNHRFSLEI